MEGVGGEESGVGEGERNNKVYFWVFYKKE